MKQTQIRPEYAQIAEYVIDTYPELEDLKEHPCMIAYLGSKKEKKSSGRITHADCTKVSDRYKWCCDYDFFITVYEKNCAGMTDEQMEILMLHELMHIGVDVDDEENVHYFIRPHDIEDFSVILSRYGLDWASTEPKQMSITDLQMAAKN